MTRMDTELLPATEANVARAAELLRAGRLVAFPTETVYGLGANALDAAAVAGIFAAKGRPAHNPVIAHIAEVGAIGKVAASVPAVAETLAARFWPGPLTLVLPRGPRVPDVVTGGGPTVAMRVPAHPVARALLETAGIPVAAPSANRSTELSPTTAQHVWRSLRGRIDLLLDGGPCPGGLESTVLDVTTSPPRLLRPGPIPPAELEALVGPIERVNSLELPGRPLPAPGMMARHYAPRTPLEVVADGALRVRELAEQGLHVVRVTRQSVQGSGAIVLPTNAPEYAAQLYAVLHHLDTLGLDAIVVDALPETDDWLAVRDRLRRATRP